MTGEQFLVGAIVLGIVLGGIASFAAGWMIASLHSRWRERRKPPPF